MEATFIKFKNIIIVGMMLIFLVSLSTVVASEMDGTDLMTTDGNLTDDLAVPDTAIDESVQENTNDEPSSGSEDVLSAGSNEDVLSADGTLSELRGDVNSQRSTGYVSLERNYYASANNQQLALNTGDNNIIIDGKGHIISGNGKTTRLVYNTHK